MEPTSEQILNAVTSSGYLFEQEIASIFEQKGFFVKTNVAFKDTEEEKSREMDVMGYKRIHFDEEKKIAVGIRVLVECKNNLNPYVFICRSKNSIDENYVPPNFLFPQEDYYIPLEDQPGRSLKKTAFEYFNLKQCFPFHQKDVKAVQFCKIIRKGKDWQAQHDGVYDSLIIPIVKCLEFFKKADRIKTDWKYFTIYYPIIALNADIYSIDSSRNPRTIEKMDYITFLREIHSKIFKNRYLFDFVTKKALERYIDTNVFAFANKFTEAITRKLDLQ